MKYKELTEIVEFVCLGHFEPLMDRCKYCEKDELNDGCECYRPVCQTHYIEEKNIEEY